ncbi:MAG TPA: fibronectin type III domain-containing protein, partial [Thermoanaerobaculia bacterium]|nr:fibronectin type III domain-containing protein [Thermoanaerobaculia bacterium]
PLNRPLHAWPEAAWFASSDAVEEFPVGALPAELASYDTLVPHVLARTYDQIDLSGIPGLMTYGVYPRYWGKWGSDEMDCGADDPTPGTTWDNSFWCGSWTDYHNTLVNVPVWAMRSGEVEWLDEFAFPGALRTLHTQIMQCGPTEKWFYCGQSPSGYGAYRSDFNSSHAYFDNLFLYYWLTGDSTVTRTLLRGGDSMRRWMCPQRGPSPVLEPHGPDGAACADDAPLNGSAIMAGRVASQWISVFRFLGLASDDASFLEDFRSSLGRAYTLQYAELVRNGVRYGFLNDHAVLPTGINTARPVLQMNLYDATNLARFLRDTDDQAIGIPALKPSQLLTSLARTMKDLEPTVMGDGTIQGRWPHGIFYTYTGGRIGGTLLTTTPEDRELYGPEKTTSVALLVRAGQMGGDASLIDRGREMTLFTLKAAIGEDAPLGKLNGQYLQRLHSAVARLAGIPAAPLVTPPAAPASLSAQTLSQTEIALTWTDSSSDEDLFKVERSTAGGAYQEILTLAAGVTTARVSGLTAGTSYSFRIRAANTAGDSPYSPAASAKTLEILTVPAAPTALIAAKVSPTEALLTWIDNSNNEAEFVVERLLNGVYQPVLTLPANSISARVTGLKTGVSYTFRVGARNTAGVAYSRSANVNLF